MLKKIWFVADVKAESNFASLHSLCDELSTLVSVFEDMVCRQDSYFICCSCSSCRMDSLSLSLFVALLFGTSTRNTFLSKNTCGLLLLLYIFSV